MLEALIAYRRLLGETEEEIEPLDPEQMKRDQAALRERKVKAKEALEAKKAKKRKAEQEKARLKAVKAEQHRLAQEHLEAIRRATMKAAAEQEAKTLYDKAMAQASGRLMRQKAPPVLTDEDIEKMREAM